jgi:hypothetical protein
VFSKKNKQTKKKKTEILFFVEMFFILSFSLSVEIKRKKCFLSEKTVQE